MISSFVTDPFEWPQKSPHAQCHLHQQSYKLHFWSLFQKKKKLSYFLIKECINSFSKVDNIPSRPFTAVLYRVLQQCLQQWGSVVDSFASWHSCYHQHIRSCAGEKASLHMASTHYPGSRWPSTSYCCCWEMLDTVFWAEKQEKRQLNMFPRLVKLLIDWVLKKKLNLHLGPFWVPSNSSRDTHCLLHMIYLSHSKDNIMHNMKFLYVKNSCYC